MPDKFDLYAEYKKRKAAEREIQLAAWAEEYQLPRVIRGEVVDRPQQAPREGDPVWRVEDDESVG